MIKITHFVNPHKFYFMWHEEGAGTNTLVDQTECEIRDIWNGNRQIVDQNVKVGDVIGIFNPDWHKCIRGTLEEHSENGLMQVFAIDYGVPMLAQRANCFKLPPELETMDPELRIHLGGILNCVPAQKYHDFLTDEISILISTRSEFHWSEKAITISKKGIESGKHFQFDIVTQFNAPNYMKHSFGYLTIHKSNGRLVDLINVLTKNEVAKKVVENWPKLFEILEAEYYR